MFGKSEIPGNERAGQNFTLSNQLRILFDIYSQLTVFETLPLLKSLTIVIICLDRSCTF